MKSRCILLSSSIFFVLLTSCTGNTQNQRTHSNVGGGCEGCEAIYEYGNKNLTSQDTIPGYTTSTSKIILEGRVYAKDAVTPVEGVIIYAYQTNEEGIYRPSSNPAGWEKRHGKHRGWVISDKNGYYKFYTFRPGSYPDSDNPQHIHLTVKEKDKNEYYIDSIHFGDDPLLSIKIKDMMKDRGGSGIVTPVRNGPDLVIKRDIILGKNIPGYPN